MIYRVWNKFRSHKTIRWNYKFTSQNWYIYIFFFFKWWNMRCFRGGKIFKIKIKGQMDRRHINKCLDMKWLWDPFLEILLFNLYGTQFPFLCCCLYFYPPTQLKCLLTNFFFYSFSAFFILNQLYHFHKKNKKF